MNRRVFIGHLSKGAAAIAIGSALTLQGCNAIADIEAWIPTGENAVNAILSILTANGVPISPAITAAVALVEDALNALMAAAKEYQATTPPPVGALAKLQAALSAVSDQFQNFVSQLSGIAGTVLAVVISLVKVIISTIGGFVSQLPASPSLMAHLNSRPMIAAPPVLRSTDDFKHTWNDQLQSASKTGVACPSGAYLKRGFFHRVF